MPTCTAPRLPPPASTNAVKFFPYLGMALARSRAARLRYPRLGELSDNRALRARRHCRSEVAETCLDMRPVTERLVGRVPAAAEHEPRAAECGSKPLVA